MKTEFSAGGIVFNHARQVLVVQHSSNNHWGFPKGHIEANQSVEEAALREVREEGGVEAKIIERIGESKYFFVSKKQKIFKTVTMFLMEYVSGDITDHDTEISQSGWYNTEDAVIRLSFKQDKEHLQKALKMYKQ